MASPIGLPDAHVQSSHDGHDICYLVSDENLGSGGDCHEDRTPDLEPVRPVGPVANDVHDPLASRVLDPPYTSSFGCVPRGQPPPLALRQLRYSLTDDLAALIHLVHPYPVSRIAVPVRVSRYFEVQLGIDRIGHVL